MSTKQAQAIAATHAIAELLKKFSPTAADPFSGIGPSDEFLATHLPDSVIEPEQLDKLIAAVDKAAREGNMQTINAILATVQKIAGPLLGMFGI